VQLLLSDIENAVVEILKRASGVPRDRVLAGRVDVKSLELPVVLVFSVGFKAEDMGVGGSYSVKREFKEVLDGDGRSRSFKLKMKPLKPLRSVEHPLGEKLKEGVDYTVDYDSWVITFSKPPAKGVGNIAVTYLTPMEGRAVKLISKLHVEAWSRDRGEVDEVAASVVKSMLMAEEELAERGLSIRLLEGYRRRLNDVYCESLIYEVESQVSVEYQAARIEKVEVEHKRVA